MKRLSVFTILMVLSGAITYSLSANRIVKTLNDGWEFSKEGQSWQHVRIPHDWAISGPFDIENDLQTVAIEQNNETTKTLKTGRTGGLPFIGKGYYRTTIEISDTTGLSHTLLFDGAMGNTRVKVNGKEVAYWPYGYNSFQVDITPVAIPGENTVEVSLENFKQASRWYPGAGLYRNVHLISTDKIHIPVWGTYITTPYVSKDAATVSMTMDIEGLVRNQKVEVATDIIAPDGKVVATKRSPYKFRNQSFTQSFLVQNPELWSPKNPARYIARTRIFNDGKELDRYDTKFGIRKLEFIPEKGFFLNGIPTKFKGVCNHHDLGPLGAAINRSALRHQIDLLKDMGANAIRTSHNMPAPELVDLCDEMGMMMMIESFDDWGFNPKSPNGYGRFFNEWAERDITNMVKAYRNSPSVVMWSIGNEVNSQYGEIGMDELTMLQDLVHRLDPTRPVTCGMNHLGAVIENGFAAALDIPGFNYKPQSYDWARSQLPQGLILGSETASTVSSRGVYHFPVYFKDHNQVIHSDNQSSSYDTETCSWSNTPDIDFAMDDDHDWVIGQFVWTGFDYLGEPSPYDTDAWPSHSSYFGIFDLASLPKDRFYLYRSKWNTESPTLHVLPHWNWKGHEGDTIPIFVYTSYPKAELFVNGESQGIQEKNNSTYQNRYRLMWNDVVYAPGELKVIAYDDNGTPQAEKIIRTTGKPHHLVVTPNRDKLSASGDDLVYLTIQVADKDGNLVPTADNTVSFKVNGAGTFEATANGDATCILPLREPKMKLFSGAATAIVRSSDIPGILKFKVSSPGLKPAIVELSVE